MPSIRKLSDVVDWRLCVGCGACAYICPERKVSLHDFLNEGIRPMPDNDSCRDCRLCLDVCPSVQTDFAALHQSRAPDAFTREWGQVLDIWEGHATDPEIRFKGSSGGALTALSAYCLEVLKMPGVLHIAQDPADPIRNRTRLSRTRAELLAAAGSRYAPASVCDSLELVEKAPGECVIIGKPSEIAAVSNARRLRKSLDAKIGVTLSFFCAESPSTAGTAALLRKFGIAPEAVSDLRYRGFGWPGYFSVVRKGSDRAQELQTYRESWAFLQSFRPWSVHLWPDGSGELADISCGDPWYEEPDGKNPGFSLIVVRTERGRKIIQGAMDSGYLQLKRAEHWKLEKSQGGLLRKKGAVWGRRLASRMFGLPVTRFDGADLFHSWRKLPTGEKLRSTVGTARRILSRKFYRPLKLQKNDAKGHVAPLG